MILSTVSLFDGMLQVEPQCPFCGVTQILIVKRNEFVAWQYGMVIQRAMPQASASVREALLTGTCDACFPKED